MMGPRTKLLWQWLAEAKHPWLAFIVTGVALWVALRPGAGEQVIRLVGLVLQLMGILTVVWGISQTRALFGRPPLVTQAKDWFRRFPLRRRSAVVLAASCTIEGSLGKVRAIGTHGPGPNPTIEARVAALERNILSLNERITAVQTEMDAVFRKNTDALQAEARDRRQEDASIRKRVEAMGTGGVHISAIGACWLFFGVILASAAPELAQMLN